VVSILSFLLWFYTVGWVTGMASRPWKNFCHLSAMVLFQNKWSKKTEWKLAHPGSHGKCPVKRS